MSTLFLVFFLDKSLNGYYDVTEMWFTRFDMGKKEKQLARLQSKPKDFAYQELASLLKGLGYIEDNAGKTSRSRVAFVHPETLSIIRLHKPHPNNELHAYQIDYIIEKLKESGEI